jgi:hypothetical protein
MWSHKKMWVLPLAVQGGRACHLPVAPGTHEKKIFKLPLLHLFYLIMQ